MNHALSPFPSIKGAVKQLVFRMYYQKYLWLGKEPNFAALIWGWETGNNQLVWKLSELNAAPGEILNAGKVVVIDAVVVVEKHR